MVDLARGLEVADKLFQLTGLNLLKSRARKDGRQLEARTRWGGWSRRSQIGRTLLSCESEAGSIPGNDGVSAREPSM